MPDTLQAARVTRARSRLLLDHPWFGTLALRLTIVADDKQPTLSTDGTHLTYNPTFTETLTDPQLMGVLAHEVMHCAMLHPYRTNGRNMKRWNEACDYAINPLIRASGLTLPADVLDDPKYHGMAAEQIYAVLSKEDDKQPDGKPGGWSKPEPSTGNFTSAPEPQPGDDEPDPNGTPVDMPMSETDWQIVAEQAANVTRKAGNMPGDIDRAIKQIRDGQVDWRTILHQFIENVVPSDYSWSTPNRRYVSAGLYLPGTIKENTPRIAVAVDTSASISQPLLDQFAAELTAIMLDVRPIAVDVIYCDTYVRKVDTFVPDDGEITLHPYGGGGTLFQPVFDWVADQDEPPACLIYATDLEGPAPTEPDYPVLWLTEDTTRLVGPFGETVRIPPVN